MNKHKKLFLLIFVICLVGLISVLYFMKDNIYKVNNNRPKWKKPNNNDYGNKYNPLSRRRQILKRLEEEDKLEAKQKLQRAFQHTNINNVNNALNKIKNPTNYEKMKKTSAFFSSIQN